MEPRTKPTLQRCIALIFAAFIVALIFGCGGGGGGGGGQVTRIGNISNIQLIGVYMGTNTGANLATLAPGDQVQLELVGVDTTTNQTAQVPIASVSTNVPSTVATVSATGLVQAIAQSSSTYKVTATASGINFTQTIGVTGPVAKVSGLVRLPDLTGQVGVTILFYDSSSNLVGQVVSGTDGSFLANVPTTAASFTINATAAIDPETLGGFYTAFYYGSYTYSTSLANCHTALPALTVGSTTALPNQIVLIPTDSGNPPPPPTGCQ